MKLKAAAYQPVKKEEKAGPTNLKPKWICSVCTLININNKTEQCEACSTPAPAEAYLTAEEEKNQEEKPIPKKSEGTEGAEGATKDEAGADDEALAVQEKTEEEKKVELDKQQKLNKIE